MFDMQLLFSVKQEKSYLVFHKLKMSLVKKLHNCISELFQWELTNNVQKCVTIQPHQIPGETDGMQTI